MEYPTASHESGVSASHLYIIMIAGYDCPYCREPHAVISHVFILFHDSHGHKHSLRIHEYPLPPAENTRRISRDVGIKHAAKRCGEGNNECIHPRIRCDDFYNICIADFFTDFRNKAEREMRRNKIISTSVITVSTASVFDTVSTIRFMGKL